MSYDGTWSTGVILPPCTTCGGGGSGGGGPGGRYHADYGINGMFSDQPLIIPPPPPPPGPAGELPEPGSAFLLFLGFGAMAGIHRRRSGRATLKAAVAGN